MGTITIVLSEDVERELRKTVKDMFGTEKGALSKFIEDAIRNYIQLLKKADKIYRAYKGEKLIAEAKSLEELAEILRKRGIDIRGLRIVCSDLKKVARAGYRLRA